MNSTSPSRGTIIAVYVIVLLLYIAAVGGVLDLIWWHRYVGRDSFFIPPHNVLYISMGLGLIISICMWTIERTKMWRWSTFAFILPPLVAPIDEVWHTVFFREKASSVWAYWSPPHLIIEWSFAVMFLIILITIRRAKYLRGRYMIETVLWSLIIVDFFAQLRPVMPTGTIYQVLGFWGTGPLVFVVIFMMLTAQFFTRGKHTALCVALSYLSFIAIVGIVGFLILWTKELNYDAVISSFIGGYRAPPGWLHIIAWISAALVLDATQGKSSKIYPAIAGVLHGGLVYGISSPFVGEAFRFPWQDSLIAFGISIICGYLAACAFEYCKNTASWQKWAIL